jgi:hypothetical protein
VEGGTVGNGLGDTVGDGLDDTVGVGVADPVGLGDVVGDALGEALGEVLGDVPGVLVGVALRPGVLRPGTLPAVPVGEAVTLCPGEGFGSEADGDDEQAAIPAQAMRATTPKAAQVSLALSRT